MYSQGSPSKFFLIGKPAWAGHFLKELACPFSSQGLRMTLDLVLRMATLPCWPGLCPLSLDGQVMEDSVLSLSHWIPGSLCYSRLAFAWITSSDIYLYWHLCCLPLTCLRGQDEPLFAKVDSSPRGVPFFICDLAPASTHSLA